jgi:hypothetical protein
VPAPQLHLTFGRLVAENPRVPARLRHACAREPVYVRLGSIFHDLPYYGNMAVEAIRYGLGAAAIDEPWAYRMHSVEPDRFVASYIRAAAQSSQLVPEEKLALVGGLISHCALDLTLHPLVNHCARRDVEREGGHESFHHRLAEKYHALFFHLERLGEDPIGTSQFRRATRVVKDGSYLSAKVEPAIVRFMQDAYRGAYGDAPDVDRWSGWVRNFSHFGVLVGGPMARRNSLRVRKSAELRARYFENHEFSFWDHYARSEQRVVELTRLSFDYFEAGDFSPASEAAFRRSARIDDLAEPRSDEIDGLPAAIRLAG